MPARPQCCALPRKFDRPKLPTLTAPGSSHHPDPQHLLLIPVPTRRALILGCCRFTALPRPMRLLPQKRPAQQGPQPSTSFGQSAGDLSRLAAATIDRYYLSRHCAVSLRLLSALNDMCLASRNLVLSCLESTSPGPNNALSGACCSCIQVSRLLCSTLHCIQSQQPANRQA